MRPYFEQDGIAIYHGDCREIVPSLAFDVVVTDPPYPNNAGYFDDAVATARAMASTWTSEALVFWTEIEHPPVGLPLVAVHVWHRSNVNGRPYEPVYHFAADGRKRRSDVMRHSVPFEGGTHSGYLGHPTQKPVPVMAQLLRKTRGVVLDPFAGIGTTLVAAQELGRKAIGVEIEERYCEIAAQRLAQGVLTAVA